MLDVEARLRDLLGEIQAEQARFGTYADRIQFVLGDQPPNEPELPSEASSNGHSGARTGSVRLTPEMVRDAVVRFQKIPPPLPGRGAALM